MLRRNDAAAAASLRKKILASRLPDEDLSPENLLQLIDIIRRYRKRQRDPGSSSTHAKPNRC